MVYLQSLFKLNKTFKKYKQTPTYIDIRKRSMAQGTVKWFNNSKGFGFIRPEDGGEDIFAHYSTIQMEGYRTLKAGQDVDYELDAGAKGDHAASITPTDIDPTKD